MKKLSIIIAMFFCVLFCFSGCAVTSDVSENISTTYFEASELEDLHADFLDDCEDRTSFTQAETDTANYISDMFVDMGYTTSLQDVIYTYTETSYSGLSSYDTEYKFSSQNVICKMTGADATSASKNIVIGASYDNIYSYGNLSDIYNENTGNSGLGVSGALMATGAVASFALADKLAEYDSRYGLDYNVEFVFFGAEIYGCYGSSEYASSLKGGDVDLYIDMGNFGGDDIYSYFDEVSTEHGELFMSTADDLGYDNYIREMDSSFGTIAISTTQDKIPYTNYALTSSAGILFGEGIKISAFTTGAWDSLVLYNRESMSYDNLRFTSNDKLGLLKSNCPQYSSQMAVVLDTIYESMTTNSAGLLVALDADIYDYTWLTFPLVAFLGTILLMLIFAVILVLVVKHFEKKYPHVIKKEKVVKMSVFGTEYEEKKDGVEYFDAKVSNADPFSDSDMIVNERPRDNDENDPFS